MAAAERKPLHKLYVQMIGIDRFISEARALTNLVGSGVATLVVGKWCGELDGQRMRQVLDNETDEEAEEPEKILDEVETHMPVKTLPAVAKGA